MYSKILFIMAKAAISVALIIPLLANGVHCRHVTATALHLRRSTATTSELLLAAEDANLFQSRVETNHVGYTGSGFIDYGDVGSYATWNVDVPASGTYRLSIRYASTNGRGPMPVMIGENKVGEFAIESTNSWTNWLTETITVSLSPGSGQQLKLLASVIRGPNVDNLVLKQLDSESNPTPVFKPVLQPNESLVQNQFVPCESGAYEVGLSSSGDLVVRDKASATVLWSLEAAVNMIIPGEKMYMQDDGNLVIRETGGRAVWDSKTYGNPGSYFGINQKGAIAVIKDTNDRQELWTGGLGNRNAPGPSTPTMPTPPEALQPTPQPVPAETPPPTPQPTLAPPTDNVPSENAPATTILRGSQSLQRGKFILSPNGLYKVGLNSRGNLIMVHGTKEVWRLKDKNFRDIANVARAFMQSDGNLVLRDSSGRSKWNSETSNNADSEFRINDGGQLSVVYRGTALWIDGLPRQVYVGPSSPNLQFPIRGMFYYAWYPETWSVGGKDVFYRPNLGAIPQGQYNSGDPVVAKEHVKALDYALTDLSIVSWWGPCDRLDRARITQLMDETIRQNSPVKWTVYYEDELEENYSVAEIERDLAYLKKWFAWHPTWAHKEGKPVIFVWNEGTCEVAQRWTEAGRRANWYVVLKLFGGYKNCPNQPDSWHQYGVADDYLENPPESFAIAPGFWKANDPAPRHPRIGRIRFCDQVNRMNQSGRDWQLVISFNEWGEGTAVESAVEWQSASGYGDYLDCLHDPIRFG